MMCLKSLQSSFPMEFLHEKIAQKIADRGATIAIESQMSFQIEIGIAIAISISKQDRDRDRDLNFGDRGLALDIIQKSL